VVVVASLEWYDFFPYTSAAALVFNQLFFPDTDPITGTLLAFTTSATGFVAWADGRDRLRHYGNQVGRKTFLGGARDGEFEVPQLQQPAGSIVTPAAGGRPWRQAAGRIPGVPVAWHPLRHG
jgi:hypothetical protein